MSDELTPTTTEIQSKILQGIFKCKTNGQVPVSILFSCEENLLQQSVESFDTFVKDAEAIRQSYRDASTTFQFALNEELLGLPDEMLITTVEELLKTVTSSRKISPESIPDVVYVMSYSEQVVAERNSFLDNFFKKNKITDIISEYVSTEYKPSPEVLEIAALSALFSKAMNNAPKGLWTPGSN